MDSGDRISEWLRLALSASIEAGRAVLDVYEQDDPGVEYKSDQSPLTEADRAAHQVLQSALASTSIPVLSEEGKHMPFETRQSWDQLWIVDPVDGTKEFIKRNGEFTVNVALVQHGRVAGGVVLAPALGYAYAGIVGQGAWRVDVGECRDLTFDDVWSTRSALPLDDGTNRPYTIVASRSHMSSETEAYVALAKEQFGQVELVSKGSSLKLCMVAEGSADVYPRFAPTMEWDTAAGQAICEAAGCSVIDQDTGLPMQYNRKELLNAWFLVSRTTPAD